MTSCDIMRRSCDCAVCSHDLQTTDACLKHIGRNCHELLTLNIKGCKVSPQHISYTTVFWFLSRISCFLYSLYNFTHTGSSPPPPPPPLPPLLPHLPPPPPPPPRSITSHTLALLLLLLLLLLLFLLFFLIFLLLLLLLAL